MTVKYRFLDSLRSLGMTLHESSRAKSRDLHLQRSLTVASCLLAPLGALHAQTSTWQPSPGHVQQPVWPGAAPDARPAAGPETATFSPNEHLVAGKP